MGSPKRSAATSPDKNATKFPAKAVKMFPDKNVVKNPERVATKNQNKVAQPFTSAKFANKPNTVVNLSFSIYDLFPYFYSLHTIPTNLPTYSPILQELSTLHFGITTF